MCRGRNGVASASLSGARAGGTMAPVAGDRDRLRTTFDGAALLYDEVRPGYP